MFDIYFRTNCFWHEILGANEFHTQRFGNKVSFYFINYFKFNTNKFLNIFKHNDYIKLFACLANKYQINLIIYRQQFAIYSIQIKLLYPIIRFLRI